MEEYKKVAPNIRPRVDHRWSLEKVNRQLQRVAGRERSMADAIPFGVWTDHVAYHLVWVRQDNCRAILQADLDRWGVTFQTACNDAFKNLFAETTLDFSSVISARNFYELHESTWSSGDHAARLMWPALLELQVPGRLLVFLIGRKKMIVTGADSNSGLANAIRKIGQTSWDDGLPPMPLLLEKDQVSIWQPPVGHPYHAHVKDLADTYLSRVYAEQYGILSAECGCDDDFSVSRFLLCQDRRLNQRSQATVFANVRATSLPKTDEVVFVKHETGDRQIQIQAILSWDVMQAMMSDRVIKLDCYPDRYLLDGYPTDDDLERFCPYSMPQVAIEYPPRVDEQSAFVPWPRLRILGSVERVVAKEAAKPIAPFDALLLNDVADLEGREPSEAMMESSLRSDDQVSFAPEENPVQHVQWIDPASVEF